MSSPPSSDGAIHDPRRELLVPEVARERSAVRPASRISRGVIGVLLLLRQVGDRDVGALAREGDRDRTADAGVAAGDERPRPSSRPAPR